MGVSVSVLNHKNEEVIAESQKTIFDYCKEGLLAKVMDCLDGFPEDDEVHCRLFYCYIKDSI